MIIDVKLINNNDVGGKVKYLFTLRSIAAGSRSMKIKIVLLVVHKLAKDTVVETGE